MQKMNFRESTEAECRGKTSGNVDPLTQRTQLELDVIAGIADALARYTGTITVLPSCKMSDDTQREFGKSNYPAKPVEKAEVKCKMCAEPAFYGRLMLCRHHYNTMTRLSRPEKRKAESKY